MRQSTRPLSAFAIAAYLIATLLPCVALERLQPDLGVHSIAISPSRAEASRDAEAIALGSDEKSHDHASHEHGDSSAHAHSTPENAAEESEVVEADAEEMPISTATLALTAPCVCGCSDTRAQVGGGAARLGAAVPGAGLTSLLAAPVIQPPSRDVVHYIFEVREIDPIPV